MDNKYVKIHSLVRMFAALVAIAAFISMFIAEQAVHPDFDGVVATFSNGAYFGGTDMWKYGNFISFIGYLLIFVGGLAGLAFVFIDEMLGKDLVKKLSFVVAGAMLLGAISLFLFGPLFNGFNGIKQSYNMLNTAAAPIVFGVLAVIAAACNAAAPILEDKGY